MATQKVSVTLGTDSLEKARALAGPRGLSAYLDEAVRAQLERDERRRAFLDLVEHLERDDPSTEAERAEARRWADQLQRRLA